MSIKCVHVMKNLTNLRIKNVKLYLLFILDKILLPIIIFNYVMKKLFIYKLKKLYFIFL